MELLSDPHIDTTGLQLPSWIAKRLPLEVDLGCGKGRFLAALAEMFPDVRFVGVERQKERIAKCNKKFKRRSLENAEVIRAECEQAVEELFPPESVDCFYVLCPDPWPKRRHHRRRLINVDFIETIRLRLKPGGFLRLLTDDKSYFDKMTEACHASLPRGFKLCDWDQGREFPQTDFQKTFVDQGLPIHRIAIQKV